MLSRGRALGDGPDQTASCDVRPGGRPGITFRREPACVPLASGVQHSPQATRPQRFLVAASPRTSSASQARHLAMHKRFTQR